MSLVNINGLIPWPMPPFGLAGSYSMTPTTIGAANEMVAGMVQAPKAGTISKVIFRTRTVATGDANCAMRLEVIDPATGLPDGNLVAAGAEDTVLDIDSADDNALITSPLATPYVCTHGELIAVVILGPTSGTPDIDIARFTESSGVDFPYSGINSGGWTKSIGKLMVAFEYSDGSYAPTFGMTIFEGFATIQYDNADSLNEYGNRFRLPFDCLCAGCWFWIDADGDFDGKLYLAPTTASTSPLATFSFDKDIREGSGGEFRPALFTTPVYLSANVWYRIGAYATGTAANVGITGGGVDTVAQMDWLSGGADIHRTDRSGTTGTWNDTTTARVMCGIMISQIPGSAGGIGGGFNRGFANG